MSERENDIEFDFFEEPDTRETAEERPKRRGPRPPVRPPTGLTPLLRLIGLICFAILIILLLVLWVNGCREDKRKDAYRNYVKQVSDYASESQRLGRQFNTLLTSRGHEGVRRRERARRARRSSRTRSRTTRGTSILRAICATRTRTCSTSFELQVERPARDERGVPIDRELEERRCGRRRSRGADAALHRQRRALAGLLQGADQGRATAAQRHGRERSGLGLPPRTRTSRHPRR